MTQTYTPPAPVTSAAPGRLRLALLLVWAALTLAAFAFVAALGTNAPYADEWEFVPALLGHEASLPWLWQQHNEHRMPLPRAVVLAYFALTYDFRAGSVLQVLMLSGLALGLMRLAARLRGRAHWADAFFPVSLLHLGHWENLIMGYQVCFVLYCVLATAIAVVALRITPANAFRSGLFAAGLLVLLVLTGGSGLAAALPISVWLGYVAVVVGRREAAWKAALLFLFAVLPLAYLAVYFQGYHRPEHHPVPSTDPLAVGRVAAEVLAVSLGIAVQPFPVWGFFSAGLVALGVATLAIILPRWKEPTERLSVAGLVAVAAGVTGVAIAVGIGRGAWGRGLDWSEGMGLWSRYAMLTWPLVGTAYLVWVRSGRKWVPIGLCVAAALLFPGNTGAGIVNGATVKGDYSAIEADLAAGLTPEQITDERDRQRRFPVSHQGAQKERAIRAIPMLRAARVGIFAK